MLAALAAHARVFEQIADEQVEELYVQTEDGVHEKLIHIKNPGKPIVLLEPGLGAQGTSLELPATALALRGDYDVFIGNWRGSAKLPSGLTPFGERNGLPEILRYDLPAHLRHILNHYATPEQKAQGVRLLGHSMGGMMIASTLSDPGLAAEFKPYIKAIVLLQSPHHLKYLQLKMKVLARLGMPTLAALRALGVKAIDMHSRLLIHSKETKERGGLRGRYLTPAVENFAMALTKLAISPAHTGREFMRRAFFKMPAYSIPIDLMQDFGAAVLNDGEFLGHDGDRLIKPEAINGIPVQVVRSKLDTLAQWKQKGEYFRALGTADKQLLNLPEMNHIDTVLHTRADLDFFDHVLAFFKNPAEEARANPRLDFEPRCESLLTRMGLKLRLRGI